MATFLNLFSSSAGLLGIIPGVFSWRFRFQKDDKLLSVAKRTHLESKIHELAQKLGINKPLELIEKKGLMGGGQAQGVAFFSCRAGIAINPDDVNEISEEELEFLIAHELSHIKANDLIWMGAVYGIVSVTSTLAMSILVPSSAAYFSPMVMATFTISSPAAAVGLSVSFIAFVFFSKWREECADKLGFSICSGAAQKAAPQYFDAIRKSQIEHRNDNEGSYLSKLWRRCLITEEGEFRLDVFHPSLKNRIKYLQPI
jgi:Zn-dependent protease with chaperone function